MKKLSILAIILLSVLSVFGQTSHRKLTIGHLTGDFYIYTTYQKFKGHLTPSNSMYMLTKKGAVLFDTPWDATQFQPLLDSIKVKHHQPVVMCIATHSHSDRTAGLEYYRQQGIKTYPTTQTDRISTTTNEKRAEFLISKDSTFNIGGHRFETFYPGPGHTIDNIVIWFDKEKLLYGGCLIKSTEAKDLGNLADANVKEWSKTIKNIQHKFGKPRYIITGHQSWTSNKSLEHTFKLIQQYKQKQSEL